MFRERSNLGMKRERSRLADMGQSPGQDDVNVAVPNSAPGGDGSYESLVSDAEGKYNAGDFEGSLMAYSAALGAYPTRLEILDGLTKAQTALEQKMATPDPSNSGSASRVAFGQASTPSRVNSSLGPAAVHGAPPPPPRGPSQAFGSPPSQAGRAPSFGSPPPQQPGRAPSFGSPPPPMQPGRTPSQAFGSPSPQQPYGTPAPGAPVPAPRAPSQAFGTPGPGPRQPSQASGPTSPPPPQGWGAPMPRVPSQAGPPGAPSYGGASPTGAPTPAFAAGAAAAAGAMAPTPAGFQPPPAARAPSQVSAGGSAFLSVPDAPVRENSRLINKPMRSISSMGRPITPAGRAVDSKAMVQAQMAKIQEDMNQELWDRVQARSEELINDIRKVDPKKMNKEEKEILLASVYNSLGKADFAMGNMDKALEDHQLALHIAETYDLFDVKTAADESIGRLHMSLGREASTVWEETINVEKDILPRPVEMPIPGNLTRTKTIMATEDNPTMVDIAMPATVKTLESEEQSLNDLLKMAEMKSAEGDHEGALMLYSAAQTKDPHNENIVRGLKRSEAALQESMAGAMTARTAADKKVRFNKGWQAAGDIEDAPVYLDPKAAGEGLRAFAERTLAEIADDIENGDAGGAQNTCEAFLEKFGNMTDDVTLAERFTYLATVHNQLGRALAALGNNYKAITEHNAALQIAERNGLDNLRVQSLDLIARIQLSKGEYDQAIGSWNKCLTLSVSPAEKSELYHKMALAEIQRENYDEAKINADQAVAAGKKAKSAKLQMNAYIILGMAQALNSDRTGAIKEYKRALKLEKKINDPETKEDIERRIAALEEGDVAEATTVPQNAVDAVAVCLDSLPPSDASSKMTSVEPSRAPSRRTSVGVPPAPLMTQAVSDTLTMMQMYLLWTLPEF